MNKIELIDRIALLEMLPQICDELNGCAAPYNFDERCVGCEVYMLHTLLTEAPTIDAAPVRRGEWKYFHKQNRAVCTQCSFERNLDDDFGAAVSCPNCGADMRGASE